ncbi:MAG: universal stress protein, partial [Chloroflexota bacterium]
MNALPARLLLCTNASPQSLPALEYGGWLAGALGQSVLLMGIVERESARFDLERLIDRTAFTLRSSGVEVESLIRTGRAEAVIADQARQREYLTLVGHLGRPFLRRLTRGSSFRELLALVGTPIVLVPQVRLPLRRLLICTGGLMFSFSLERLAAALACAAGASITLLHVVEPVSLDYPLAREVETHWRNLLETDTPQARNLLTARRIAEEAGVPVEIRIRHGGPVHEILHELRAGEYDLVGLGSPYSSHTLRHLFMPNVTAEVAEAAHCPVLS